MSKSAKRKPHGGGRSGGDSAGAGGGGTDVFVNPYTFVPFVEPGETFRGKPTGHHRLDTGRYLGEVTVRLTARSPLLLRGITPDGASSFPRRDGTPYLPGSSLAGVVRSLHELIAGGCLRVFDHEFIPGYRDLAAMRGADWRLVRVEKVDESNRPTALTVCAGDEVWVTAKVLAQALGGARNVVSGATVEVSGWDKKTFAGEGREQMSRLEATRGPDDTDPQVGGGDGWVVLVADSGARKPTGRGQNRTYKSFYCVTGRLTEQIATLSDEAWKGFQITVADTDDMRGARGDKKKPLRPDRPVVTEVRHAYDQGGEVLVGKRHEARPALFPGQVLWARLDPAGAVVRELALAAIWRHPGRYPAGDRVPKELLPCREPGQLCPTCRVFGSVDAVGGDPNAEQRSYRGHLRFSDALPVGEVDTRPHDLAPLGAPRPGAGQFYLTTPKSGAARGTPLREWGSAADPDPDRPRRLNGRKQYWLTGRPQQRPFFRTTGPFEGKMATTAEAVDAGSVFTFTVRFDGLTEGELGALLAALAPQQVLVEHLPKKGGREIGVAVGGGRPLGFGTCVTEITDLVVEDARSRYAGGLAPRLDLAQAVAAFRAEVDQEVVDTWKAVATALRLDHVDPTDVWYPPDGAITKGPLRHADLEPGFEFWRRSRGLKHDSAGREDDKLIQLPPIDAGSQELSIPTREDRGRQQR